MKTIIDSWSFTDLFSKGFWESNIPGVGYPNQQQGMQIISFDQMFGMPPGFQPMGQPTDPNFAQDPIIEYWSMFPDYIKAHFLKERSIFNLWIDMISESEYIIFTDLIEEKRFGTFDKFLKENEMIKSVISDPEILSEIKKEQQTAGKFDPLFMDFLTKIVITDAIILNTAEILFIGGNDSRKINKIRANFLSKGFTMLQELHFMTPTETKRNKKIRVVIMKMHDETPDTNN